MSSAYYLFILVWSVLGACGDVFLSHGEGYFYPPPPVLPPVQLEEPTPIYIPALPPIFSDEAPLVPTPNPPPISYLPPAINSDDSIVVPAQSDQPPLQVRVENMSCTQGINFRATFKMANDSPHQFPVVDDATDGCISLVNGNRFRIDLGDFNSMLKCGVKRCGAQSRNEEVTPRNSDGNNMCVMMRIPTVRGVRLPEDALVTLMCTPQDRVVSQTRHVKLGSNRIQQVSRARTNTGIVAAGGTQKDLRTRIGIFRRRPGSTIFDQNVQTDSVIQLGEELVLRAIVNDGDGWKGSQIGPVLITGLNSKKSALLVNQQGCVNAEMRSICPKPPLKLNPLSTELHFRAFLFQESPQGDEMVVSVRTQACLHVQDCTREGSCVDNVTARSKREVANSEVYRHQNDSNTLEEIINWESQLSFQVKPLLKKNDEKPMSNSIFLGISLAGAMLSMFTVILLLWQAIKRPK